MNYVDYNAPAPFSLDVKSIYILCAKSDNFSVFRLYLIVATGNDNDILIYDDPFLSIDDANAVLLTMDGWSPNTDDWLSYDNLDTKYIEYAHSLDDGYACRQFDI